MKRRIAFLMIVIMILGMFGGCKSNEDDFSVDSSFAGSEQMDWGDDSDDDIAESDEQEQDEPSQNEEEKQPQEDPTKQDTPDPDPEKDQEEEVDSEPEQEQKEEEPDPEPNEEEKEPIEVGGGPLFEASENPYKKSLKILAFGNSFSKDAMQHLWKIAKSYGVETVVLGNLNIGGCSLETHYTNMSQNLPAYTYTKNTNGEWENTKNVTALSGLRDESWDIITIQQASDQNASASTYSNLSEILQYLEQKKPKKDTKILWHMTWAYQSDSTKKAFQEYNNNQITMYEAILKRVKDDVLCFDNFVGVIPAGTAIQNLRKTSVGDTLTRDGYHLSYGLGRYVAALTWYCYITGADPFEARFVPLEDQVEIYLHQEEIAQSVADAIREPYEIT